MLLLAYVVTYNSDTVEGRGFNEVYGYFTDIGLANYAADKAPKVMGVQSTSSVKPIEICTATAIEDYEKIFIKEKKKANALKKLTPEEREILGL